MILCRNERGRLGRIQPNRGDCSCIIDTGFNGGSLRSFNFLAKYIDCVRDINQRAKIAKTIENLCDFSVGFRSQEARRSQR